jgi:hypothetical protein
MPLRSIKMETYFTDYPFVRLGDDSGVEAPIRRIQLISFDGTKYVRILLIDHNLYEEIKWSYIFTSSGRLGEVPVISFDEVKQLLEVHFP